MGNDFFEGNGCLLSVLMVGAGLFFISMGINIFSDAFDAYSETVPLIILGIFCSSLGIALIGFWVKAYQQSSVEDKHETEKILQQTNTLQDAYSLTPTEFEILVKSLFEKMGYTAKTTPATGDGGIDLYLTKNDQTELVQCKRYQGNISVQHVREFYGVMVSKRVTKGYIVSTGHFTLPSRKFAEGKGIHLIDGPELADMLASVGLDENIDETPDSA